MAKLIYPELSYQLIGIAYKAYNSLGFGLHEKFYQRAFANELKNNNISFDKELQVDLVYNEEKIGKYYLDFIVEDKIILELKVAPRLRHIHLRQVFEYLKVLNKRLAILIFFTDEGVRYRRIINPNFVERD
jgi:GxxExxY protein